MAIDSFSVNQNATLATERFSYLGDKGPADLAIAIASPRGVSTESALAYAAAVGQEVNSGNVPTASEETTSSLGERLLKPPLFGYVAVALFLALLAIVLLVILVIRLLGGGKKQPEETAAVIEETPVDQPLTEAVEPVVEEPENSAAEALVAGAVVAGVAAATDRDESAEAVEKPEDVTEAPAVVEETEEQGASRLGSAAAVLATGAAIAGIVAQSDAGPEEEEATGAEVVAMEAVAVEEQPVETSEVVRAVEEVAGGDAPFEGVVSTVEGAVQETPAEESGGSGVLGAAVAAGAAAAALGWALESDSEKTEDGIEPPEVAPEVVATAGEWTPEAPAAEELAEEPPKDFLGKYNRPIVEIEGIGDAYAGRLVEAGITTTHGLLQQCATRKGREELADKTGISGKLILEWANHADMMRVQGIGPQWSDLLEMVGVNTVRELALRNAENLHQKLVEVNTEKALVRQLPTLGQVEDWIEQAKDLPRILTY
jgi:predicted flap endonuclease-1-like 5' DNA nuclease